MPNFNKVTLMGHLTRDPELKYLPSGSACVEFGLAVNRHWNDKMSGEKKEEVCFVDITFFGPPAELINKSLKKGHAIFLEGYLKFDSWEAKDGTRRSKLKVTGLNFQFIHRQKGADSAPATEISEPEPEQKSILIPNDEIPF